MGSKKTNIKTNIKVDASKIDFLGTKPVGKAVAGLIKKGSKSTIEGAEKFLSLTCSPFFEELGLLMKDKLSAYRYNNIIKTLIKAEGKLEYDYSAGQYTVHPRVGYQLLEQASMVEDETLQDMWAGLFVASCTAGENSDENIFFLNILQQLTGSQVRLLNHVCIKSNKNLNFRKINEKPVPSIIAETVNLSPEQVYEITENTDYAKVCREIIALNSSGLISNTTSNNLYATDLFEWGEICIAPTFTMLQLYMLCKGSNENVIDFYTPEIRKPYDDVFTHFGELSNDEFLKRMEKATQLRSTYGANLDSEKKTIRVNESFLNNPEDSKTEIIEAVLLENFRSNNPHQKSYSVTSMFNTIGTYSIEKGFQEL